MWRNQVGTFAALGRVVLIDGPGHGRSEVPPPFTLEDHADALTDAFADLGIHTVIAIGLSWGGMVAMRLAIKHPSRVQAMVLMDTSADREPRANALKYRLFASVGRRLGLAPWLLDAQVVPLMFAPSTRAERPDLIEDFVRSAHGFPRDGVARAAKAVVVKRTSVLERLGEVRVPTLVLCGREDRAQPPSESEKIARALPEARLVVIDGAGHLSALERPVEVNDACMSFLRPLFAR
jgi:3-oxoadipate enol-lactonase